MLEKIRDHLNTNPEMRTFIIALILILSFAITTSFVWIPADQIIAPPGLRLLDWLWKLLIV